MIETASLTPPPEDALERRLSVPVRLGEPVTPELLAAYSTLLLYAANMTGVRLVNDPDQQEALRNAIKAHPELLFKAAEHAVGKPRQAVTVPRASL